jgi:hypothetical protein
MLTIILGIFFVLHGLVHLLYVGQSRRLFELHPGMVWPDSSWLFMNLVGDEKARLLASLLLALAALGFVASGVGVLIRQAWWRPVTVGAALISSAILILFWNGKFQSLHDQGAIALLINLAILAVVLFGKWPA